jgi:hypothetical protein
VSARKLHVVAPAQEQPADLTLAMRAEIEARDWAAVHIRGDRNPSLGFFDRVRRTWLQ